MVLHFLFCKCNQRIYKEIYIGDKLNSNVWFYEDFCDVIDNVDFFTVKENVYGKYIVCCTKNLQDPTNNTKFCSVSKPNLGYRNFCCVSKFFMNGFRVQPTFLISRSM